MNYVLIFFLFFVIIIAIYAIYVYYDPSFLIRKSVPLNVSTTRSVIPVDSLDNPGSIRYFYETWIYINNNSPVKYSNVIFNRGKDFIVSLKGSTLELYINTTTANLDAQPVGVLNTNDLTPFMTVPDFPFQKWCQLVINVDGKSVDLYIDGKFVQNKVNPLPINTNITDPISYGNNYTQGRMTRFRRPPVNINPQGVWNSYMVGSGENMSISNYHLNAQITNKNQVRVDQRIL